VAVPLALDTTEGPLGDLTAQVDRALGRDDLRFPDWLELGRAQLDLGGTLPEGMVDEVLAAQQANGGWDDEGDPDGERPDLRTTAIAVDLLVRAGVDPAGQQLESALELVGESQGDDGWAVRGNRADPLATAAAVTIIRALGFDPAGPCWQVHLGIEPTDATAEDHLVALQDEDGSFAGDHPVLTTSEAVHALSGRWLPRGRAADRCSAPTEQQSFPISLVVLGAIAVIGVGGGIRILRGGGQSL
jgi:hypothetical protein